MCMVKINLIVLFLLFCLALPRSCLARSCLRTPYKISADSPTNLIFPRARPQPQVRFVRLLHGPRQCARGHLQGHRDVRRPGVRAAAKGQPPDRLVPCARDGAPAARPRQQEPGEEGASPARSRVDRAGRLQGRTTALGRKAIGALSRRYAKF